MTAWFVTKNGRLFTRAVVGIAATGLFGTQIAFHGPLLNKYQQLMQMYSGGLPKPLPSEVLETADLVLNECGLDEAKKKKVKFFTVIGRDLFHAGGTNFLWGAIIGLPFTFGIKTRSDFDLNSMKVTGKENINWSSEGEQLLQSLILSENAKKFAIAREVFACNIQNTFVNASLSAFAVLFPARLVQKVNESGKAFNYSFWTRSAFYVVVYTLGFVLYKCLKDPEKHLVDKKCDKKAAGLGPEYLEGGIEFYEKTLSKNKSLRNIMGPDGERLYDLNGNESYFIFVPLLPVSKRLELLQNMKQKQAEDAGS